MEMLPVFGKDEILLKHSLPESEDIIFRFLGSQASATLDEELRKMCR